jgi:hypothetical protein
MIALPPPTARRSHVRLAAVGVVFAVAFVLLGAIPLSGGSSGTALTTAASTSNGCPGQPLPTPICHVFVVYFENEEANATLRQPFFRYLAQHYDYASEFFSVEHYSFPNYLAATSGEPNNWIHPIHASNVGNLIEDSKLNLTWASYMQSMPYACDRNTSAGPYRLAHDPMVWYDNVYSNASYCKAHVLPFTAWNSAVKYDTLPNYAFLAANTTNDCWKTGLPACDAWLQSWLTPLVNDSFFQHSAFIITFDEGATTDLSGVNGTTGGGHVYATVVSPYACLGNSTSYNYNAFDILTTTEWLLHLGRTGHNDSFAQHPPMRDMFCFPPGTVHGGGSPAGAPLALTMRGILSATAGPIAVRSLPVSLRGVHLPR